MFMSAPEAHATSRPTPSLLSPQMSAQRRLEPNKEMLKNRPRNVQMWLLESFLLPLEQRNGQMLSDFFDTHDKTEGGVEVEAALHSSASWWGEDLGRNPA